MSLAAKLREISSIRSKMKKRTSGCEHAFISIKEKCCEAARTGLFHIDYQFVKLNQRYSIMKKNIPIEELDDYELELYSRLLDEGFKVEISRFSQIEDNFDRTYSHTVNIYI